MKQPKEGIFEDMPYEEYEAIPAMRSSVIKNISKTCPKIAKYEIDNPEDKSAYDFGKAAHLYFLEPEKFEKGVKFIDAKDWRTNAAKDAAEDARAIGQIPLLEKDREKIAFMRNSFYENQAVKDYLKNYKAEVTMVWRDVETGMWCKARPDIMGTHISGKKFMGNFKTQASVNPLDFKRALDNFGYSQEVDWYLQGHKHLTGETIDYIFFAQEKKPPFIFAPFMASNSTMENGFLENQRAKKILAYCMTTDDWYGYRDPRTPNKDGIITVDLPTYALYRTEERLQMESGDD